MPVRNLGWYNRSEVTAYPVDEAASAVSDAGDRLPPDIITDINLRWSHAEGACAFLTAVSVTDTLVTLTIQSADSPLADAGRTALAAISVRRPVDLGRMYQLQAQVDGVGGWIAFGRGANGVPYRGRFATPQQSRLAPRAARAYRALPVSGLGVLGASTVLSGVVRLRGRDPVQVVREQREIEGVLRDVAVVRLVEGVEADGFPVPSDATKLLGVSSPSVFRQFSGPCAGRPESNTCGFPVPIEFINAVGPDCYGVLTLEFASCAEVTQIIGGCGVAVDCQLGLIDACLPAQLPNSAGFLPSEYTAANVPLPVPPVVPPVDPGESESLVEVGSLPFWDCFMTEESVEMTDIAGEWLWYEDDSPTPCYETVGGSASFSSGAVGSYVANSASVRNVAIWDGFDDSTVFRRVTTEVKLTAGPAGAKHNGGIVLNYRLNETSGQYVYHLAEIDYDSQQLRISRFNGTIFQKVVDATVPGISLDAWYRLTVTVLPGPTPGQTALAVRLESVETGDVDASISTTVSNYTPSIGRFGLGSNRAVTRFAYFRVEQFDG